MSICAKCGCAPRITCDCPLAALRAREAELAERVRVLEGAGLDCEVVLSSLGCVQYCPEGDCDSCDLRRRLFALLRPAAGKDGAP